MSAGLNGWGEGGTFDCQEEGVDGQAPAGMTMSRNGYMDPLLVDELTEDSCG